MSVERASHQKHLGTYEKLKFKMHIETVFCRVNKGISIIKKKLWHTLPRKSLLFTKHF